MEIKREITNPICTITWYDAAHSYEKELPKDLPPLQVTTGFIVTANDEFVHIATHVNYDPEKKQITPIDGHIIPNNTIIEFRKIGEFEKNND